MSEFTDFLPEAFEAFGPISVKRMFGGHGVFHDGLMIGLVADETLYLKADAESRGDFTERGLPQFEYPKNGKRIGMSYFAAPEEALEDRDIMRDWARRAYAAAVRSKR